jgi:hypothetical protein
VEHVVNDLGERPIIRGGDSLVKLVESIIKQIILIGIINADKLLYLIFKILIQ